MRLEARTFAPDTRAATAPVSPDQTTDVLDRILQGVGSTPIGKVNIIPGLGQYLGLTQQDTDYFIRRAVESSEVRVQDEREKGRVLTRDEITALTLLCDVYLDTPGDSKDVDSDWRRAAKKLLEELPEDHRLRPIFAIEGIGESDATVARNVHKNSKANGEVHTNGVVFEPEQEVLDLLSADPLTDSLLLGGSDAIEDEIGSSPIVYPQMSDLVSVRTPMDQGTFVPERIRKALRAEEMKKIHFTKPLTSLQEEALGQWSREAVEQEVKNVPNTTIMDVMYSNFPVEIARFSLLFKGVRFSNKLNKPWIIPAIVRGEVMARDVVLEGRHMVKYMEENGLETLLDLHKHFHRWAKDHPEFDGIDYQDHYPFR